MLKNSEVLDAFSQLGKSQVVPASVRKSVSMYTCNLYGGRGTFRDVNHARHMLLSKKIPQRKAKQNLTKLKSFDPATLPPCLCVLEQKIARVNFVTHVWTNAHKACIDEWDPLKHGWLEDKTGHLAPNWFNGQRVPNNLFHEEPEMEDEMSDDNSGADSDNDSNSESDVDSGEENSDSDNDSNV